MNEESDNSEEPPPRFTVASLFVLLTLAAFFFGLLTVVFGPEQARTVVAIVFTYITIGFGAAAFVLALRHICRDRIDRAKDTSDSTPEKTTSEEQESSNQFSVSDLLFWMTLLSVWLAFTSWFTERDEIPGLVLNFVLPVLAGSFCFRRFLRWYKPRHYPFMRWLGRLTAGWRELPAVESKRPRRAEADEG